MSLNGPYTVGVGTYFGALTPPAVHTGNFCSQQNHILIIYGRVGCDNFKSKPFSFKS